MDQVLNNLKDLFNQYSIDIKKEFGLTYPHSLIANLILAKLENSYTEFFLFSPRNVEELINAMKLIGQEVSNDDFYYTRDILLLDLGLIEKGDDISKLKITFKGKKLLLKYGENGFSHYLLAELIDTLDKKQHENLSKDIDKLNLKHLKGSIFQIKYAWVFFLINAALAFLIAYLTKN